MLENKRLQLIILSFFICGKSFANEAKYIFKCSLTTEGKQITSQASYISGIPTGGVNDEDFEEKQINEKFVIDQGQIMIFNVDHDLRRQFIVNFGRFIVPYESTQRSNFVAYIGVKEGENFNLLKKFKYPYNNKFNTKLIKSKHTLYDKKYEIKCLLSKHSDLITKKIERKRFPANKKQ